jgi:hypothetical protein
MLSGAIVVHITSEHGKHFMESMFGFARLCIKWCLSLCLVYQQEKEPKNLCQTYDKSAYNMCLIYNLGSYLSHLLLSILKLVIDIYSSAKGKITMIQKGDNISMTNSNMLLPFLVSSLSY